MFVVICGAPLLRFSMGELGHDSVPLRFIGSTTTQRSRITRTTRPTRAKPCACSPSCWPTSTLAMRMMLRRYYWKRAARRRPPSPYRQGDLDGLCGVDSAVNAIRALCPEVDTDDAGWLFDHLIQQLPKSGANVTSAVANGDGQNLAGYRIAIMGAGASKRLIEFAPPSQHPDLQPNAGFVAAWPARDCRLVPRHSSDPPSPHP